MSLGFPFRSPHHNVFAQGRTEPDLLTLHNGWARLTTNPLGYMLSRPLEGYFFAGTHLVDHYNLRVNNEEIKTSFCCNTSSSTWSALCYIPGSSEEGDLPEGHLPRGSLEVSIQRSLEYSWIEEIKLKSYSQVERQISFQMEIGCPVGDAELSEEMKKESSSRYKRIAPEVVKSKDKLSLRYERHFGVRVHAPTAELARLYGNNSPENGEEVIRGIVISINSIPEMTPVVRQFSDEITEIKVDFLCPPQGEVNFRIDFVPEINRQKHKTIVNLDHKPIPLERPAIPSNFTLVRSSNSTFDLIIAQAQMDLASLRLSAVETDDTGPTAFNAGIPRYMGIFSRDILTTAWQSAIFTPDYIDQALSVIKLHRGVRIDSWRDEEPDQIAHERRLNPMAALGETNREIYYGDVASTPFWITTLGAAYNWTNDKSVLERHWDCFESCCRWIDRKLVSGNGFIYYAPSHSAGNRHHAWKDSGDAIVDSNGRIHVPPLATAEIQGYCYLAFLSAVQISFAMREFKLAKEFWSKAKRLKSNFNKKFWMPDQNFFAVAIDENGKPVDSVASNIGHCLGCGIIDEDKIEPTIRRLMSEDMFSGWGIRTLSSSNPAYDPFSYHRGSVWPVENSTIAAGIFMCGFREEALRIIDGQLMAASIFPRMRLPETLSGHARSERYPIPGVYPHTNLLQAWSVSAISLFLQVILGLRAFAPFHLLELSPTLPEWLEWIELHDLKVGNCELSLRFWRDQKGNSLWEVLDKKGHLFVIEQPAQFDPQTTFLKRLKEAIMSV